MSITVTEHAMKQKMAKELEPGDIVLEEGRRLTVKKTGRGFWRGAVLVDWVEPVDPQWSCVHGNEVLHVAC